MADILNRTESTEFCRRIDCWYNYDGWCSCCDDYRNFENPEKCNSYIADEEN